MSSRKTITINPELFSMTKSKKKDKAKTQKKKEKKFNFVNPNQLRKNLLSKIKEHKNRSEQTGGNSEKIVEKNIPETNDDSSSNIEKFTSNFKDSMNYLSDLVEKEKKETPKRKRKQRSLKNRSKQTNFDPDSIEVNLKLPDEFNSINYNTIPDNYSYQLTSTPPYGCLKGGDKPTFRQWKTSTQKNFTFDEDFEDDEESEFDEEIKMIEKNKEETPTPEPKVTIDTSIGTQTIREKKLQQLRDKNNLVTKKTLKKRYKLGKSKNGQSISVLIKSTQTKKKVLDEKKKLENEDMKNIKKYLREHNLIKVGTVTPNDVLKQMYEASILSGYVKNNSDDVSLHNYLNE